MSADVSEDRIQDYLDGRLSEGQRAAFEKRLADDADLARRVAAYRSIGKALREDEPVLSPGFYTRARARFDAAQPGRRRGWRLLSWEVAGLSAAVLLAAAVFLPGLIKEEEPFTPPDERGAPVDGPGRADLEEAQAIEDDREEMKKEAAPKGRLTDEFAPAPPPVEREVEVGEKGKADANVPALGRAVADAPAPAAEAAAAEPTALRQESGGRRQRVAGAEATSADRPAVRSKLATVGEIVTLPAGTLEPGIVLVTDEGAWPESAWDKDQTVEKRFAEVPSAEGAYRDGIKRIVLIGARPGLVDCSSVAVELSENAYVVHIPPRGREDEPAAVECAVRLPADDREILVMEAAGDD